MFANVTEPRGLLHLPDLDPPQVAVCSSEDNEVKFFTMDGAPSTTVGGISRGALVPYDVIVHPSDPGSLVVAYQRTKNGVIQVFNECFLESCSPSSAVYPLFGNEFNPASISTSPGGEEILASDFSRVKKCSPATGTCSEFITQPSTLTYWMPTVVFVDHERELVLVCDSENLEVHAFDSTGNLVHSEGMPYVRGILGERAQKKSCGFCPFAPWRASEQL